MSIIIPFFSLETHFPQLPSNQQTRPTHLLGLAQPHGLQHRGRHVPEHPVLRLEAPPARRVRHDERYLVRRVRRLGLALVVEHLLGIAVLLHRQPNQNVVRGIGI